MLCQLSYVLVNESVGAGGAIRTRDILLGRQKLYR